MAVSLNMKSLKTVLYCLVCILLVACDKAPTPEQEQLVNNLIQEQIDIPYVEQNWHALKERLAEDGETVEQAADRNKKLYSETHDFLLALQRKSYKEKRRWAMWGIENQIELFEKSLAWLVERDADTTEVQTQLDKLVKMKKALEQ